MEGVEFGKQAMIVLVDCWAVHCSKTFRDWVKKEFEYIRLMFVPPNCTSKCEPCDTGIQKPFKDGVKRGYNGWLAARVKESERGTLINLGMTVVKTPSLAWFLASWQALAALLQVIRNAWKAAGLDCLQDEAYKAHVRADNWIRYLQEVEPEAELEVVIEVAMDIKDLEEEDRPAPEPEPSEAAPESSADVLARREVYMQAAKPRAPSAFMRERREVTAFVPFGCAFVLCVPAMAN